MANQVQPDGKRVFNDVYSFPQDSQDLADDLYEAYNLRVGTTVERDSLPVARQKPGMLWADSDTGLLYRTDGASAWEIVPNKLGEGDITASTALWDFEWPGYLPGKVTREGGRIFMQGIMSNAQSVSVAGNQEYKVATIPIAYAPAATVYFPTLAAGNGQAVISVRNNGDVYFLSLFTGGPYSQGSLTVWLDGSSWPAS